MRMLFLHRYFPGPFRQIAMNFSAMPNNTTLFLSERGNKNLRLPGVRRLRVAPITIQDVTDDVERQSTAALRQASKAANAMLRLRREGFIPDIIYYAASEGYAFYARDIFPESLMVARADWFFTQGESHTFFNKGKPRPPADFAIGRVRNLTQYNNIGDCDMALTSTAWQKAQYPGFLSEKIQVIHEGVDTRFFSPMPGSRFNSPTCDLSSVQELVTFSFRYSGPSRGFPQFAASLPLLLALRPACHVLIMASRPEYGPKQESDAAWLASLQASLPDDPELKKRIHVVDFTSIADYRKLLRASSVHLYLTAPFALSAGLFEAMSCGALVLGSDTAPVREVIRHGQNGFLCDFWDSEALAQTLAGVLERNQRFMPIREAARNTILQEYDQSMQSSRHRQLILDALARRGTVD